MFLDNILIFIINVLFLSMCLMCVRCCIWIVLEDYTYIYDFENKIVNKFKKFFNIKG
jgi:hypothetical protein